MALVDEAFDGVQDRPHVGVLGCGRYRIAAAEDGL